LFDPTVTDQDRCIFNLRAIHCGKGVDIAQDQRSHCLKLVSCPVDSLAISARSTRWNRVEWSLTRLTKTPEGAENMSSIIKLPTDAIRIVIPGKDAGRRGTGPFVKDEDAAREDKGR
jgi:hypothetical protein